MKQLILTADDYGASNFIDRGIERAIRAGRINTVSAFVTHQDSEERIKNLLKFRQENGLDFSIGLHFSMTSGNAMTGISTLTAKNNHTFREAQNYKFRGTKNEEITAELITQLDFLENILGETPIDHVSNHHGIVYLDLSFFDAFLNGIEVFTKNNQEKYKNPIPIRSPRPWSQTGLKAKKFDGLIFPIIKEGLKLGIWKKFLQAKKFTEKELNAKLKAINHPDFLADTIYGQPFTENLVGLLENYQEKFFSSEFMFHLGEGENDENDLHGIDKKYFEKREKELNALLELPLENIIQNFEIQLTNFTNLNKQWNLPNTPQLS